MSLPLDFHPAVRGEIDDAHDWYEQRRPGLARISHRRAFTDKTNPILARGRFSDDVRGRRQREADRHQAVAGLSIDLSQHPNTTPINATRTPNRGHDSVLMPQAFLTLPLTARRQRARRHRPTQVRVYLSEHRSVRPSARQRHPHLSRRHANQRAYLQ